MEKIFPKRLVTSLIALIAIFAWGGLAYAQTQVSSPKVFASHFKEEFGCSPSEYRRKSQNDNNNQ